MSKLKTYLCILCIININCLTCSAVKTDTGECNNIIIEGGEQALRKIFNDFDEIKSIVKDLKSNYEVYQGENNATKRDMPFFDERYDEMAEKCKTSTLPKDCAAATACTKRSGIYKIQIEQYSSEPFLVACDAETENGDWLLIQRRQDGSVDFYREWEDYEKGFGDINGEFFVGLKKLHALTTYNGPQELLIVMEDANAKKAFAKYESFAVGNETETYKLKSLGRYSGTAGNSLQYHIGMKFSTKEHDNDVDSSNCAVTYTGAWWYNKCLYSNLNGKYGETASGRGINWKAYRGFNESLTYVKMMIRRSRII